MKKWKRNKHGAIIGITDEFKELLNVMRNAKRALDGDTADHLMWSQSFAPELWSKKLLNEFYDATVLSSMMLGGDYEK